MGGLCPILFFKRFLLGDTGQEVLKKTLFGVVLLVVAYFVLPFL